MLNLHERANVPFMRSLILQRLVPHDLTQVWVQVSPLWAPRVRLSGRKDFIVTTSPRIKTIFISFLRFFKMLEVTGFSSEISTITLSFCLLVFLQAIKIRLVMKFQMARILWCLQLMMFEMLMIIMNCIMKGSCYILQLKRLPVSKLNTCTVLEG